VTPLHDHAQGCVLCIRVVPNASRNSVDGAVGETLKIRLRAPPVEGKANKALVAILAERLGVREREIILLAGETARTKRVLVKGLHAGEVARLLGIPAAT